MAEQPLIRISPVLVDNHQLIQNELAAVLATTHFSSSKRYPAFLSYVVQKTLDGHTDDLKERTIGIDVFQRKPDFDTNSDTVVRFTAGEVRKRLALIYLEAPVDHKVHIELPVGSYVPDFFGFAAPEHPIEAEAIVDDHPSLSIIAPTPMDSAPLNTGGRSFSISPRWLTAIGLLCLLCISLTYLVRSRASQRPTSLDRFWQPVRASARPPLICVGGFVFSREIMNGMAMAGKSEEYPYISLASTESVAKLTDMFGRSHMDYRIQPTASTTLTDMREHPTILLGAYNNDWTLRLLDDLRFRFAQKPAVQIYDATDPSRVWTRPASLPYKDADDFAIVARFHDKLTDNLVFVIAGLGKNGTVAATEFATSSRYLDLLDQSQAKDWSERNFEIILRAKVIDGNTGSPFIEAVHVW